MALQEILTDFGIKVDTEELGKANSLVGGFTKRLGSLKGVLGALGGAFAVRGVFDFALNTAVATDNLDKAAIAAGVATREFARWGQIVQNNGGSLEDTSNAIKKFGKNVGDAEKGNKDLQASFRKMGVSLRDNDGNFRSTSDIMEDAVLNLDKMGSSARQTQVALKLFGDVGLTMIRVNKGGAESLREQKEEFDRLQGVDFDNFVEKSKAVAVSLDNWRNRTDALVNRIVGALLPVLTPVIDGVNALIEGFLDLTNGSNLLTAVVWTLVAALGALAVAGLIAIAPLLPPIAAVATAIGGVVLIVDDLITLFSGGRSVIGGILDDLFGFGTAQRFVDAMRIAFQGLVDLFKAAVDALADLLGQMDKAIGLAVDVGESVGGFFGDVGDFFSSDGDEDSLVGRVRTVNKVIDRTAAQGRAIGASVVDTGTVINMTVNGGPQEVVAAARQGAQTFRRESDRAIRDVKEYLDSR